MLLRNHFTQKPQQIHKRLRNSSENAKKLSKTSANENQNLLKIKKEPSAKQTHWKFDP